MARTGGYGVFKRSGHRFTDRKRVKTKIKIPILIQSEPKGFG
jgi:hypothetical protein